MWTQPLSNAGAILPLCSVSLIRMIWRLSKTASASRESCYFKTSLGQGPLPSFLSGRWHDQLHLGAAVPPWLLARSHCQFYAMWTSLRGNLAKWLPVSSNQAKKQAKRHKWLPAHTNICMHIWASRKWQLPHETQRWHNIYMYTYVCVRAQIHAYIFPYFFRKKSSLWFATSNVFLYFIFN